MVIVVIAPITFIWVDLRTSNHGRKRCHYSAAQSYTRLFMRSPFLPSFVPIRPPPNRQLLPCSVLNRFPPSTPQRRSGATQLIAIDLLSSVIIVATLNPAPPRRAPASAGAAPRRCGAASSGFAVHESKPRAERGSFCGGGAAAD